ncbi:unnamed protein product [Tuber melanosporum]|uniref:(Perigord truffle) hypothetical protein n=1 Tax=Tuber melanosporum (strain Mel28) TaxID=656061 RepID=D5G652_TUBMM|nr:uncharacterized protein GSTUM_00001773001 [Tuber melanosporum]CAZ79995.1 unnamed protein product [Tuber melanosporum]
MSTSSHFASSFSTTAGGGKDSGINTANNSGNPSAPGGGGSGGGGSGDWSRRPNGTSNSSHRRPSLSTTLTHPPTSQHSQPPLTPSASNVYHPPHHFNRSGAGSAVSTSYGKEDLLSIFKAQEQNGTLREVKDLLLGDLGSGSGGGWGRGGDEAGGAEVCWDKEAGSKPVSLEDMSEEEKELFASNVNSPHKAPPNQNNQGATNHHNTNHTPPQNRNKITAPPGAGATGVNRPTNRRRETSDAALTNSPFSSAPPQLPRRRTELRDEDQTREGGGRDRTLFGRWGSTSGTSGQAGDDDHGKERVEDGSGSGGRSSGLFRRGSTAWGPSGSTGGGGFASSALNSPMGTFGNGVFGGAMGGFSLQSASSEKLKTSSNAGNTGQKGSTAQPKVEEEDEQAEDTQRPRSPNPDGLREEHERERPMSSDTDPFGLGGDGDDREHDHDQRQEQQQPQHSPLPTPSLEQRMKDNSFNTTSNTQNRQGNSVSTPTKVRSDLGFSGIGTTRDGSNVGGLHQQLQNLQLNQQGHFPLHGRSREGSIGGIIGGLHEYEPLSPTETNPYQSPAPEKADDDDMPENGGGGGIIGGFRRGDVGAPGSDRSGRSSTAGLGSGIGSGLASFSSLGGGTLWGGTSGPSGLGSNTAPSSFFGSGGMLGDLNGPNTIGSGGSFSGGGIGGMGSIGGGGYGSASRASRLGQLFQQEPQVEEEQQPQQLQQVGFESNDAFGDLRFGNAFGSGRNGFGSATDSPMRERPGVMDIFNLHTTRSVGNLAAASGENTLYPRERDDPLPGIHSLHQNQPAQPAPLSAGIQPPAVQQPPQIRPPPGTVAPQQHVMVMPDKIQWTYRDPSGTVQGPFSGLEMHDWYKTGFFTQDLAVKRVEDPEFEQLGNLVRRIGNTREPFLVPLQAPANSALVQPTTSQPNTWPGVAVSSSWLNENQQPQTGGTVQPPFAGSFPSFGTTLTADQQNALERRKQEEQYLLARQREYLVQQQVFAKAHALHHQHSQQSLHSQPSFGSLQGSLQSPGGFATPVTTTTVGIGGQNSFEPGVLLRQAGAAAGSADAFGVSGGHGMPGMAGQQLQQNSQFTQQQQHVQADRLQMEQRILEMQRQQAQKAYQTQHQQVEKRQELQQAQQQAVAAVAQAQQHQSYGVHHEREDERFPQQAQERSGAVPAQHGEEPSPTLESSAWGIVPETVKPQAQPQVTEQPKVSIPKSTPSTKTSPRPTQAPTTSSNEWQNSEPAPLVQPFPPPVSSQSTVLNVGSSSMARSPSNENPHPSTSASVAPWANKDNELKQPSLTLKEIQEIEAEQQRNKEAHEAEQRRQLMAQQVANQPPPPAPGLPSTATWATSPSATPATGSASAWAKPLVKANSLPSAGAKKTLSQIQREEEARKAKTAALAASTAQAAAQIPSAPLASGKRYADLASKTSQPMVGGAWTTVGPGGKSKLGAGGPTGPLPSTPTAPAQPLRTVSSTIGIQTAKKVVPAVVPVKPAATSAEGEFHKWAMASLTGLKDGVKANELLAEMLNFPLDASLIADTIYDCSTTMDGRRFAAEFIRRKEAARIGVVIEAGSSNGGGASGWNEVAKGKANTQQTARDASPETNTAFKVVSGKKKGRR